MAAFRRFESEPFGDDSEGRFVLLEAVPEDTSDMGVDAWIDPWVLIGLIGLSMAMFPTGECGSNIGGLDQVDKVARMNLGNAGGARIYTMLKTQLRGMRS